MADAEEWGDEAVIRSGLLTQALARGVLVESVGEDLVVMVPPGRCFKLSGRFARVIQRLQSGEPIHDDEAIHQLQDIGILETPAAFSRRTVVRAGVLAAGAGMATLVLPGTAAASSGVDYIDLVGSLMLYPTPPDDPVGLRFYIYYEGDFPTDPLPGGTPSALTVEGLEVPVPLETHSPDPAEVEIQWDLDHLVDDGRDYEGTFSWGKRTIESFSRLIDN